MNSTDPRESENNSAPLSQETAGPEGDSDKNVLKRDLPKPVVIGFVVLLALGVIVPGGYKLITDASKKQAAKEEAAASFERSQDRIELRKIRKSIQQQRVTEWEPLYEGAAAYRQVERIVDPVIDSGDYNTLTSSKLERWLEADPTLLSRRNHERLTFAHMLALSGRDDLLKVLIDHRGTIDAATAEGITPLHLIALAWRRGDIEQARLLASAELLLKAKADPNHAAAEVGTPTQMAAALQAQPLFELMQQHGGDLPETIPSNLIRPEENQ